MLFHGTDWGHCVPYAEQSVEYLRSPTSSGSTAGPTLCHSVRGTGAVVHSPRHDARGQGRATRPLDQVGMS